MLALCNVRRKCLWTFLSFWDEVSWLDEMNHLSAGRDAFRPCLTLGLVPQKVTHESFGHDHWTKMFAEGFTNARACHEFKRKSLWRRLGDCNLFSSSVDLESKLKETFFKRERMAQPPGTRLRSQYMRGAHISHPTSLEEKTSGQFSFLLYLFPWIIPFGILLISLLHALFIHFAWLFMLETMCKYHWLVMKWVVIFNFRNGE